MSPRNPHHLSIESSVPPAPVAFAAARSTAQTFPPALLSLRKKRHRPAQSPNPSSNTTTRAIRRVARERQENSHPVAGRQSYKKASQHWAVFSPRSTTPLPHWAVPPAAKTLPSRSNL